MKIKRGATLAGLDIRMRPALKITARLYRKYGRELVITCGLGGTHSPGSLHYYGLAFDCRTRYFSKATLQAIYDDLRQELPTAFEAIREPTHLHIEYQAAIEK